MVRLACATSSLVQLGTQGRCCQANARCSRPRHMHGLPASVLSNHDICLLNAIATGTTVCLRQKRHYARSNRLVAPAAAQCSSNSRMSLQERRRGRHSQALRPRLRAPQMTARWSLETTSSTSGALPVQFARGVCASSGLLLQQLHLHSHRWVVRVGG